MDNENLVNVFLGLSLTKAFQYEARTHVCLHAISISNTTRQKGSHANTSMPLNYANSSFLTACKKRLRTNM